MPYIPPEVVEQARQIDLLTYLQSCEPQELVRISGNNYTTRTHDSLKISNGKWMWWSQRIGGYNALDYLVKVKGCSFMGFSAVCVGYMLCRKFGVDVKNFAIDRIPEELAGKSPKEIRAELSKTRSAMSEIGSRVSEEIYRRRADRSKDQER